MTEGERLFAERLHLGVYRIDDSGVVWRVKRRNLSKHNPSGWKDVEPKAYTRANDRGYIEIPIKRGNVDYTILAHRVVYRYFYGDIPDGHVINHLNGVKTDNRPDNLECVTQQENAIHAVQVLGLGRGERNGHAKLTDEAVRDIRSRYRRRLGQELADEYGVSCSLIIQVVKRKIWKHVS